MLMAKSKKRANDIASFKKKNYKKKKNLTKIAVLIYQGYLLVYLIEILVRVYRKTRIISDC